MKKPFLRSGHEVGYSVKTVGYGASFSKGFQPKENFKDFLNEFSEAFDMTNASYSSLFLSHFSENELILTINEGIFTNEFSELDPLEVEKNLKEIGYSDLLINFILEHQSELYGSDIIQFIAKEGQTLNIRTIDLEYGNSEFQVDL